MTAALTTSSWLSPARASLIVPLRDRFAIAALPGLIGLGNPGEIAETAYRIADAMLLERAK